MKIFVLFFFTLTVVQLPTAAQDAKQIIQYVLDLQNGKSNQSEIEMTLVRPKYTRSISMKSWSLGTDYFMIYIDEPVRLDGRKSKGQCLSLSTARDCQRTWLGDTRSGTT